MKDDGFVHLLGRCPPQIVLSASLQLRGELLLINPLVSWVHNEHILPSRTTQLFFDHILKGNTHFWDYFHELYFCFQNMIIGAIVLSGIAVPSVKSVFWSHIGATKQSSLKPPPNSDLFHWLALQSALACINSKLRVPLGKPQDTFLAIEGR